MKKKLAAISMCAVLVGAMIFGIEECREGRVVLKDSVEIKDIKSASRNKMAYVPKDRDAEALMMNDTIAANFSLPSLDEIQGKKLVLKLSKIRSMAKKGVADYTGVEVNKIKIFAYMISGLTAAIGGIFTMARLGGTSTTMGTNFEMKVLIAIYVGGVLVRGGSTARAYKVSIGSFIVMVIENGLKIKGYASSEINETAMGILLMLILFISITSENRSKKKKVKKAKLAEN